METKRWWMVGHDDKTWGPFEKAPLAALVEEGKLRADGLVCAEGETRWSPIGSVSELADVRWPPAPVATLTEAAPLSPALVAASNGGAQIIRPNELEQIAGWPTVFLSVPTLSLWGMFSFYRTMRVYRRLAKVPSTNAETLFWIFLGVTAFGVVSLPIGLGWPLLVGAVIVGAFLLRETLRLRDLAIQQLMPSLASAPGLYPALKSDDWHFGLWITGAVLCVTVFGAIVGVPILIAQALAWFEDWNRLAAMARGTSFSGAPQPA